jgi:hypothetical protein
MPSKNMKHDQVQFEEDGGIDARATPLGVQLLRPVPDDTQVECRLQLAVEVVGRNEILQRDHDRFVEAAGLGGAEHSSLTDAVDSEGTG